MIEGPILALDTSTERGSVAAGAGGLVLAEATTGVRAMHSEALLPAIEFALAAADLGPADLAAIVVGAGPGSFTGLRIAAATAKALSHALDLPLFAYSSLLCLAGSAMQAEDTPVCAVLDARRGEVYSACYSFPGLQEVTTILEPDVRHVTDLAAALSGRPAPVFVGTGAHLHADTLGRTGTIAPATLAQPRAATLLWLARVAPESGRVHDPAHWTPDYLRKPGVRRPAGL